MAKSAVILNDTSTRHHHGCTRVMRLLLAGLERHGLTVTARSPARHDWVRDPKFLRELEAANVVVINGEGTLHHGRPAGAALLSVVDHPACQAPVALINALWEKNPPEWTGPMSRMRFRAARDSASAATMAETASTCWVPDLSLSAPFYTTPAARSGILIGDSVRFNARQALARAAMSLPDARYLPTKTLSHPVLNNDLARRIVFNAYNGVASLRRPPVEIARNEVDYLTRLAQAEGQITGRFHAVCLSMLTETPFLALSSNASKIERLLIDSGIGTDRIIGATDLARPIKPPPFNSAEIDAIRAFRCMASERAEKLFGNIAALARRVE